MTLTPIVAETATASATIATPVRLRLWPIPATAMRASMPPMRDASGASRAEAARTASGTHRAKPSINRNTASNPATRLRPDSISTATATSIVTSPARAIQGNSRPVRRSSDERDMASRGGNDMASMAGTAAATSDAPVPATTPFVIDSGLTMTSVTLSRKYRSLMDCETRTSRRSPSSIPATTPSSDATDPTTAASDRMSENIRPRVTPSARRLPISERRCSTEKLTLL